MYELYFHYRYIIHIIDDMLYKAEIMTEYDRFVELIPPKDLNEIGNTYLFIQKLENIKNISDISEINIWLSQNIVNIPWDYTLKCLSILPESFEEIPSKKQPSTI